MNGAWPPSSRLSRFTWSAAPLHQLLADLGRAGEADLADGRVLEELVGDLLGRADDEVGHARRQPGVDQALEDLIRHSGVWLAGLLTMVQPAARAGAILRACSVIGKFHGLIAPTTPTGCLMRQVPLARRASWG